jgi:hypothetical protein
LVLVKSQFAPFGCAEWRELRSRMLRILVSYRLLPSLSAFSLRLLPQAQKSAPAAVDGALFRKGGKLS